MEVERFKNFICALFAGLLRFLVFYAYHHLMLDPSKNECLPKKALAKESHETKIILRVIFLERAA